MDKKNRLKYQKCCRNRKSCSNWVFYFLNSIPVQSYESNLAFFIYNNSFELAFLRVFPKEIITITGKMFITVSFRALKH